ncbi:ficolin-1 [Aplysia californica]|uniref:Ficolin-1 n=1 Tax=Aplysia californica TaxID=6500 RepID=A0ABM1A056_APLCA|nr:ficolin-1 [Aplysia californica]
MSMMSASNLLLLAALCLWLTCGTESFSNDDVTVKLACSSGPHTCADVEGLNPRPVVTLSNGLEVVCDTVTANGGWIVIQRRASADVDFYQGWASYKYGFGDPHGNFWLGLEKVHQLTTQRRYELRVDLGFNGNTYYASYSNFSLHGEPENYALQIAGYSGNASDPLTALNGTPFSTKDRDNDAYSSSCAATYHGAWWYTSCHESNLNGDWGNTNYALGLTWHPLTGYHDTVSFSEMKIRPLDN